MKEENHIVTNRKKDHIDLAFQSRLEKEDLDDRFYYEPLLGHHNAGNDLSLTFLDRKLSLPMWVSSMTGGTGRARVINHNLARACAEFGMGMGLGSCRSLLYSRESLADFNVRPIIGDKLPLYGNLGIAQVEQLVLKKDKDSFKGLIDLLQLDGLIVHVNPLQEALQPEGDVFQFDPIDTLKRLLDLIDSRVIVKEVGQGMGPESLRALLKLPIEAVDFAASGGTNFALLETLRNQEAENLKPLVSVGHSAAEMVEMTNRVLVELGKEALCKQVIVSGGVQNFLDGYYLINKVKLPAVYGQASAFLKYAMQDYESLHYYISEQVRGFSLAKSFLRVR